MSIRKDLFEILKNSDSIDEIEQMMKDAGLGDIIDEVKKSMNEAKKSSGVVFKRLAKAEKYASQEDKIVMMLMKKIFDEQLNSDISMGIVTLYMDLNAKIGKLEANVRNLAALIADK